MVKSFPGRPFLNSIDIKRFKAKHRFWPPPDSSPVIAIEPWGKQFFVYNGIKNVEIRGDPRAPDWGNTRPRWWREDIALSLLKDGEDPNQVLEGEAMPEEMANKSDNMRYTTLCVTDFRKRPLMYLSREELGVIRENLQNIKAELQNFKAKLEGTSEAREMEKLNMQLEDNKYMHIRRGRIMNPPQRSGRGVMSAPNRPQKRRT
jgi:hypothetical protein